MSDIYVAQASQGVGDGSSCTDAMALSSLDWGTVVAGDVIHLCGAISTTLNVATDDITILFESGASLSTTVWGLESAAAIYISGHSNILIDGGADGVVENTDNGTNLGSQSESTGIHLYQNNNIEIRNLTIRNIYVREALSADSFRGVRSIYAIENNGLVIHDCDIFHAEYLVHAYTQYATISGLQIYNCDLYAASTAVVASIAGNVNYENIEVFNNNIYDLYYWDGEWGDPADWHHIDGIHTWGNYEGNYVGPVKIYNNHFYGDYGAHCTARVFLENFTYDLQVFNNVFTFTGTKPSQGFIFVKGTSETTIMSGRIYENTMVGRQSLGDGGNGIHFRVYDVEIKNNIFSDMYAAIVCDTPPITFDNDYNIYHAIDRFGVISGTPYLTLADWQTYLGGCPGLGNDCSSITDDPLLDTDQKPGVGSPAIDFGLDLGTEFAFDIDGNPRPQGAAWDVGAYEPLVGTNHYVKEGGTGDGSDWDNALPDLPSSLIRGDTYYIADGNYGAHDYDDAESSGLYTLIKKSTIEDHGTDVGYVEADHDGQANFTGFQDFGSGHYVIDGNKPNGEYGFTIISAEEDWLYGIRLLGTFSNIIFRSIYMDMHLSTADQNGLGNVKCIKGGSDVSNVTMENMVMKNAGDGISLDGGPNIYDHIYFERMPDIYGAGDHGDAIVTGGSNGVIRYCTFNWDGQQIYFDSSKVFDGWQIYNNQFYSGHVIGDPWDGWASTVGILVATDPAGVTNLRVYNNSFFNLFYGIQARGASTGVVQNNIFFGNANSPSYDSLVHSYNYYETGTDPTEDNKQVGSDPFVDSANRDLRIRSDSLAVDNGADLSNYFLDDFYGNIRSLPWDIGSAELVGAAFYADPDATGANDGTSWADAWQSFGDIVWASLSPGDTLYLSDGTYPDSLVIGADGITISVSPESGHNGTVLINATNGTYGIDINSHSGITINGNNGNGLRSMEIANTPSTGIYGPDTSAIRILHVYVHDTQAGDGIRLTGTGGGTEVAYCLIEYAYQDNLKVGIINPTDFGQVKVHHNIIRYVYDDLMTADGSVDIYANEFGPWALIDYGGAEGHADGIQCYDGYLRIYDNVFKSGDLNAAVASNALLYLTNAFERDSCRNIYVYNNLFYCYGNSYANGNFWGINIADNNYGMWDIYIVNNTFADTGADGIILYTTTGPMVDVNISNNILANCHATGNTALGILAYDYANSDVNVDRNVLTRGSISFKGGYYTVDEFNALSGEEGLVDPSGGRLNNTNYPTFVNFTEGDADNANFDLQESDTGAKDLGTPISISNADPTWPDDYVGTSRPQGDGWDIGRHEYPTGGPTPSKQLYNFGGVLSRYNGILVGE